MISHRYNINKISNVNIVDDDDDTNIIDKINSVNIVFKDDETIKTEDDIKISKPDIIINCFKCNVILDNGYLTYTGEYTGTGDMICYGKCSKDINKQIDNKNKDIFIINFFDE